MKEQNSIFRQRFGYSVLACLMSVVFAGNVNADGRASDYDALPPLISTAGANDVPNVLMILDTSGSMNENEAGTYVGSNSKFSKTVISRQAIARILTKFGSIAKMGLMAFEPAPSNAYERINSSIDAQDNEWSGQNLWSGSLYNINLGYLYIPIGSVDPTATDTATINRIADFKARLGIDVVDPTLPAPLTGYYNLFRFSNSTYLTSTDWTNKRLVSEGGTPLEGSLDSALKYKNGTLPTSLIASGTSAAWPTGNVCSNRDYTILITDGLPTVNMDGTLTWVSSGGGYYDYTAGAAKVATKAESLLNAGVRTYVVGFALPAGSDPNLLNSVAAKGGTDKAYYASTPDQLLQALEGIFVDIVNRTSSGTGAAVVANRGNGLSADFQALYTPEKTDGTNVVKWVGTLQGFFIDENRKLREDTDGDGLLDGYDVDRQLEFVYDSVQGKTVVKRKLSSSATNPDSITSTITSDVEGIKALWSARDALGDLTNVLTQRNYTASAGTGRHILTSVDGETLLNFNPITPTDLSSLDSDEATLRAQISSLNTQIANAEVSLATALANLGTHVNGDVTDSINDASQEAADVKPTADGNVTTATGNLATAEAQEASMETALLAAQAAAATATSNLAAAQTVVNTATAARDSAQTAATTAANDVTAAQTVLTAATTTRDNAQTAATNAATAVSDAETALATATTTRDNAQTAVTTATTARDTVQTTVNTAQASVNTAQTTFNTANTNEIAAHAAYDDAVANRPPMHPDIQAALDAWNAAILVRDAAATDLSNKQATLVAAQSDLTAKQNTLNTANTALTTAQTAFNTASSDLSTQQGIAATAQDTLTAAQTAFNAAQTDLTAKQGVKTAADSALVSAQTTLTNAQTAYATRQGELTTANTNLATAQANYNTAAANLLTAQGNLTHAENVQDSVGAAADWVTAAQTVLTSLQAALTSASQIDSMDADARATLLSQIATLYSQMQGLMTSQPALTSDPLLADLAADIADMAAQLTTMVNLFNDADAPIDTIAEMTANLDALMTDRTNKQNALVNTRSQIDSIAYVKYMDDGITGESGDVDLTYTERNDIVKWIRGEEVSTLRNRTINYDGNAGTEVWRLADIVHSTPAVVGRPSGVYYSAYGDLTYKNYMTEKFNRRQVVYAGTNDGMLHAFNSGFWDDANKGYVTALPGDSTSVQHPLGAELWAYVPKAALPHLQFVANQGYSHMFLVDGSPQTFDVNIFADDADHPDGWGTILVVNMRLGGGPFTVRVDEDGNGTPEDVVIRPSTMIFDVTNPEAAPTLIAELTHPNMGFTFGKPALVKRRIASASGSWSNPVENRWLLVFGSGPTNLDTATSNQNGRLFVYDLSERAWADDLANNPIETTTESNAFFGDAVSEDWDRDFIDDIVYFGLNTGSAATPDGRMSRLQLRSDSSSSSWIAGATIGTLVNVDQTIIGSPSTKSDVYGRRWVYFGTGRLMVPGDNTSTQQQHLYGVMEPIDSSLELSFGSVTAGSLLDVSNIEVYLNGKVSNGPTGVDNFSKLVTYIHDNNNGWKRKLRTPATSPSGRSDTRPADYLESVFFAEYVPSSDQCKPEGKPYLYDLNYMTGTAYAQNYLASVTESSGEVRLVSNIDLGRGKMGDVTLLPSGDLVFHDSTGRVSIVSPVKGTTSLRRQSWRQIFDFGF